MPAQSLTRTLGEVLYAQEGMQAYLLIDPMLREPFAAEVLQDAKCESIAVVLRNSPLREDQWPRLVRLRPFATEILSASVEAALAEQSDAVQESEQGFAIDGWLCSAARPERLARHLAYCMRQVTPKYKNRYLRLADRRVLEWMWPQFDETERVQWLGPITQWWTLDRSARLAAHTLESPVDQAPEKAYLPKLTEQQWAHTQDCEQVQQVLRGWRSFAPALPPDYLAQAMRALSAARHLGLRESNELVLMCAYQLQIHPQLCTHPAIVAAIDKARNKALALVDVLAEIPDPEGWERIRRELQDGSAYRQAPENVQPDSSHGRSE